MNKVVIYMNGLQNYTLCFIIESEHVCNNYLHGLTGMSWCIILSFGCVCWNLRHVVKFFMLFSKSSFILTQYIDSCARSFGFSISILLVWSWSSASVFNISCIITCLPFIMIPSITAMSSLNDQYILISCGIWSLFSSHPTMMYPFSHCKWSSCAVGWYFCRIDMHSRMFVVFCIPSTFMSMLCISASLFSVSFCIDSQSAMKNCGPSLYIILTQNWCILRRMHCILCDRGATSFLNIATRGLWLVIILTSLAKQ